MVCVAGVTVKNLIVVLGGVVALVVSVVAVGREHEVRLPSLDGLDGDVASETGGLGLVLAGLLFEERDRVHVVVDAHVLVVGAILIVDRLCRVAHDGVAVDVGGCRVDRSVLVPTLDDVELELEEVIAEPVGETAGEAHLLGVGVDEHTILVAVGEACVVGGLLGAAADGDIVVVGEGGAGDGVEPVGVIALVREVGEAGADIVAIHHVEGVGEAGPAGVAGVVDGGLGIAFALLGGDDDDTSCATSTIDSGCGSVLEDVDALNILGGDGGEATLDTVDEDERRVAAVKRDDTAEADGRRAGWVARAVGDGKTGDFALDEVGGVVDVTLDEVVALDGCDGRSDIALALRAVADDDDILEFLVVRSEADSHSLGCGQLLGGVADEGEDEGSAL